MKDSHLESLHRLRQIEQAITDIEKFVTGENLETFCRKDMLQNAVLMQFIIIGEAILHVENEKLGRYHYPWNKVRSFRNLIAHDYFNIKMPAVWLIIENDLEQLKVVVRKIIREEF
jgi:uncharacterized protein with HEPN domain